MSPSAEQLRDAAKEASYYDAYIAERKGAIDHALKLGAPILLHKISLFCFQIAAASYSAGKPAAESLHWFNQSVDYESRFLSEASKYSLGDFQSIDMYAETLAGAALVQREHEAIAEIRRCTYKRPPDPVQIALFDQLAAALQGERAGYTYAEVPAGGKYSKEWSLMPPLFKSVVERVDQAFGSHLDSYLTKGWGPNAEKLAKVDKADPALRYTGKWCFLSVALCSRMGAVPKLGKKAAQYVPVDLFEAR